MPSTDPHEVERVEDWPVVTLGRNLGGGPFIRTSPRPPEEEQTYYPASAQNVLSPEEMALVVRNLGRPELPPQDVLPAIRLCSRLDTEHSSSEPEGVYPPENEPDWDPSKPLSFTPVWHTEKDEAYSLDRDIEKESDA